MRRLMPAERDSVTKKLRIGDLEGYVTVGIHPDGKPGEIFLTIQKCGSLARGLCHTVALVTSVALQHGVPLEKICEKLTNLDFEPRGATGDPLVPMVNSLSDYIGRWLTLRFGEKEKK